MIFTLAFLSSLVFVALKSFQQLNVVKGKYLLVMPTSLIMAACEVYVISLAAIRGWGWIVLPIGIGAGLGCMLSMKIHQLIK